VAHDVMKDAVLFFISCHADNYSSSDEWLDVHKTF